MLDRIATEYLALDGAGLIKEFASFEMWQKWIKLNKEIPKKINSTETCKVRVKSTPSKLSYQLQREFDAMEQSIADAEAEVVRTESIASDAVVIADHQKHATACADVANAHATVRVLYERWAELESMQQ